MTNTTDAAFYQSCCTLAITTDDELPLKMLFECNRLSIKLNARWCANATF